jgi:hypothetical protein
MDVSKLQIATSSASQRKKGARAARVVERARRLGAPFGVRPEDAPDGCVLRPRTGPAILFTRRTTQIEDPVAEEVRLAKRDELRPLGRRLALRPGTDLEKLIVEARLAGTTPVPPRAPRGKGRPQPKRSTRGLSIRVAELLRKHGLDVVAEHGSIEIRSGPLKVVRAAHSHTLRSPAGSTVTFGGALTIFRDLTSEERTLALSLGLSAQSEARVTPGSAAESKLLGLWLRRRATAAPARGPARPSTPRARRGPSTLEERRRLERLAIDALQAAGLGIAVDGRDLVYHDHVVAELAPVGSSLVVKGSPAKSLPLGTSGPDPSAVTRLATELRDEYEELLRQARGLCVEMAEAGLSVTLGREGIALGERLVWPLKRGAPSLREVFGHHAGEFLEAASEAQLLPLLDGSRPRLERSAGSVTVSSRGGLLARVFLERAETPGGTVEGNFLRPGSHWLAVAELIAADATERERREAALPTLVENPLAGLGAELRTACLNASRDIRLRRSLAYPNAATLSAGRLLITFFPVEEARSGHIVRFEHTRGAEKASGYLKLGGNDEPLPLYLPRANHNDSYVHAAVLLGFAALTVLPQQEVVVRPSRGVGGRGRRHPTWRQPRAKPEPTRRRYLNPSLTPTGRASSAHWVAGHIRHLPPGLSPSSQARAAAAAVGITIADTETWVRPHFRGFATEEHLTFEWMAPDGLEADSPESPRA